MAAIHAVLCVVVSLMCLVVGQDCPGYVAYNVEQGSTGLRADLYLAEPPCNVFGMDLPNLTLTVEYQSCAEFAY